MNAILEPAVFRRAHDLTPEPSVALVTGGFDDQVHIDLDRVHTVHSPDEARRFAAELNAIVEESIALAPSPIIKHGAPGEKDTCVTEWKG